MINGFLESGKTEFITYTLAQPDCAVLHEDRFCIVEFKLNAEGNSVEAVNYTYDKAVSQIENTLAIFERKIREAGVDFYTATEVVCNVVVA